MDHRDRIEHLKEAIHYLHQRQQILLKTPRRRTDVHRITVHIADLHEKLSRSDPKHMPAKERIAHITDAVNQLKAGAEACDAVKFREMAELMRKRMAEIEGMRYTIKD